MSFYVLCLEKEKSRDFLIFIFILLTFKHLQLHEIFFFLGILIFFYSQKYLQICNFLRRELLVIHFFFLRKGNNIPRRESLRGISCYCTFKQ